MDEKVLWELERLMRALLLLQLQVTANAEDQEKPEVLLARAGFVAREIAELIGKKEAAVAKSLQRATGKAR